jgi:hypothetical protein
MFVAFSAQQKKMELWFACKSLASSLCVEARLLTQIFDTSSQLRLEEFHLLPVDSAVGGTIAELQFLRVEASEQSFRHRIGGREQRMS